MSRSLTLWVALTACTPKPAEIEAPVPEQGPEILKGPLDGRSYGYVELNNGLQALLISDPDTDMAAASLDVHVGHYADPEDRQGLAHFLEHMLFMGTDRYPGVDDYRKFIEDHGGGSNAGTGGEHTQYHFTIEQGSLQPAFERFARFFVAPLLDPAYVERERNAVNSEYSLKIQDNWRRGRQVRKSTTHPQHPEHKFSVGNLDTLGDREGDPVYEDLRALYEAEYRPDRMAVAILGRQPVEELRALVEDNLAEVAGAPATRPERPPLFAADQLGVRINIVPLDERRELELQFPLPPQTPLWPSRPYDFLGGVFGHEGEGTLFDVLKERGWIESLGVGESSPADDQSMLSFGYTLTRQGAEHVDEIIAATFDAIALVEQQGLEAFRHEEERRMAELSFRYQEEQRPGQTVRAAARALQYYPPQNVLNYWATYEDFDPELLTDALALLTPDNLRVLLTMPDLPTDQVEPLYDVPWSIRPLTEEETTTYLGGSELPIGLPEANPYLPQDTTLVADAAAPGAPRRLSDDDARVELWSLPDASFGVPRGTLRLSLFTPVPRSDGIRTQVIHDLFVDVFLDQLSAMRYPLSLAGLQFSARGNDDSLSLQISGYDDRQAYLLEQLLTELGSFELDPDRFELLRERRIRRWRNLSTERPINQAYWRAREVLNPHSYHWGEAIPVAEALTADDVQAHAEALLQGATARLFAHGNLTDDDARAMAALVDSALAGTEAGPRPDVVVRRIPSGGSLILDAEIDHTDSVLMLRYQGDEDSVAAEARWRMLGQLLDTPFFTQLRTEQQLGYTVWAGYLDADRLPGLHMGIQSGVAGPITLLERVDTFLADYHATLAAMPEADFVTIRDGLVAKLTEAETQLSQRNGRLAEELQLGFEDFTHRQQIADEVAGLTRDEMAALYETILLSEDAGRLIVRSFGTNHTDEATDEASCTGAACIAEGAPELYRRAR